MEEVGLVLSFEETKIRLPECLNGRHRSLKIFFFLE